MRAKRRRRKAYRSSKRGSLWPVILLVAALAVFYQLADPPAESVVSTVVSGEIRVSFLNVGQGDALLIQSEENAVLIDGGETSARNTLMDLLQQAGVKTLDYVIATHPDSDHIGGLATVINQLTVKQMIMPDVNHTTATFERLLEALENENVPLITAAAGDRFSAGPIVLETLAPNSDTYSDMNNYSLVMRMVYGETAFLFTGDAEQASEQEMLVNGMSLKANVLKVGHHGSSSSSTDAFLDAVSPTVAVISCGKDNSYGHPHESVLARLARRGITVYRTDEMDTVVMVTDGKLIRLQNHTQDEEQG